MTGNNKANKSRNALVTLDDRSNDINTRKCKRMLIYEKESEKNNERKKYSSRVHGVKVYYSLG